MTSTKKIKNWKELTEFITTVNPAHNTVFLSGWVVKIGKQKNKYQSLFFTIVPNTELPPIPIDSPNEQSEK